MCQSPYDLAVGVSDAQRPPESVEEEPRLVHRGVGGVGKGGDGLLLVHRLAQLPVLALLRPHLGRDLGDAASRVPVAPEGLCSRVHRAGGLASSINLTIFSAGVIGIPFNEIPVWPMHNVSVLPSL